MPYLVGQFHAKFAGSHEKKFNPSAVYVTLSKGSLIPYTIPSDYVSSINRF